MFNCIDYLAKEARKRRTQQNKLWYVCARAGRPSHRQGAGGAALASALNLDVNSYFNGSMDEDCNHYPILMRQKRSSQNVNSMKALNKKLATEKELKFHIKKKSCKIRPCAAKWKRCLARLVMIEKLITVVVK